MTKYFRAARHWFWVTPVILGIAFIGGGLYMISEGREAKDEVRDALVAENITTSQDASIPGVLVDDADTAESQAEVIRMHALESADGDTYATVERYIAKDGVSTTNDRELALLDPEGNPVANPVRNTIFQSVALRTSLNLAVMGFKVSDLVIGLGFFMVAMGAITALFLAPAVYWAAEVAKEHEKAAEQAKKTTPGTATQQPA
jgi:hypothetical protein